MLKWLNNKMFEIYIVSKKRNFESQREEDDYYVKSTQVYKTQFTAGSAIRTRTNFRETKMDAYGQESKFYDYINTASSTADDLVAADASMLFLHELSLMPEGMMH